MQNLFWLTCQSMETLATNQPFSQQVKRDAGEHCKSFVAREVKKTKPSSWVMQSRFGVAGENAASSPNVPH